MRNPLVRLIETIFCKRNIREQYKGYYRDGVRGWRYIYIYIRNTPRLTSKSHCHRKFYSTGADWQMPSRRCMSKTGWPACKIVQQPNLRPHRDQIFIRVCIDHALLTVQVNAGGSEMNRLWWTWAIDDGVEEFQGFFWIFFEGWWYVGWVFLFIEYWG